MKTKKAIPSFFIPTCRPFASNIWLPGSRTAWFRCAGLKEGDFVLDCTLGMGADSIVASYVVGEKGRVVALESEPVIAAIAGHGLQTYRTGRKALNEAMRRVEIVQARLSDLLKTIGGSIL